jgi:hypothetical protein
VVFTSIFLEKSILNSSLPQVPHEDLLHSTDCRGAEEVGAGPQATEAA